MAARLGPMRLVGLAAVVRAVHQGRVRLGELAGEILAGLGVAVPPPGRQQREQAAVQMAVPAAPPKTRLLAGLVAPRVDRRLQVEMDRMVRVVVVAVVTAALVQPESVVMVGSAWNGMPRMVRAAVVAVEVVLDRELVRQRARRRSTVVVVGAGDSVVRMARAVRARTASSL